MKFIDALYKKKKSSILQVAWFTVDSLGSTQQTKGGMWFGNALEGIQQYAGSIKFHPIWGDFHSPWIL